MSSQVQGAVRIQAENIGGIDETDVTLARDVSVLTGRNATNRTSFLQAVMAALGSDEVSLKGDADEGYVELTVDGETYSRRLTRTNGGVSFSGEPYLDDPMLAELFSFLTESNESRQAVARGDDLQDLIMRPVDTAAIRADIERLQAEKADIDDQLDHLDELKDQLPELEARLVEIDEEIETAEAELAEVEAEIEAADAGVGESKDQHEELEERLTELREARSSLEDVRYDLETERESLEALREERTEAEAELESLPDPETMDEGGIEAEIDRVRERQRSVDSTITQLQNLIEFNEEMLEGESPRMLDSVSDEGDVTDQLLPGNEGATVCWTCGSEVEQEAIAETIDRLRSLRQERIDERSAIGDELDELKTRRAERAERRRQRQQITGAIEDIEAEIEERSDRIETLESERETLESDIETLEEAVEELREQEYSEILDLHAEANEIEFEIGRLERERSDVEDELEAVETELDRRGELADERQRVQEELTDRRTRIEQIEAGAVEQFNEHMERVLDILDYDNIDRIWIERTAGSGRGVNGGSFDLHVVRSTDAGTTYEDTVDHLSESEREVTGLVFALAGYLVHDVHEQVPFMLLDSLEALDSERIAQLVDYFTDYAEHLVVALLPEDSSALDAGYHRVTEI